MGIKNLFWIIFLVKKSDFFTKTFDKFKGKNFSELKKDLTEVLINKIGPIRDEMKKLNNDKKYLIQILNTGSQKAQKISTKVLKEVYEVTGLTL